MKIFYLSIVIFFYHLMSVPFAEAAKIHGTITDKKTQEPLISAIVVINDNKYVTASGLDGSYIFKNIPAGTYKLSISYIGYQTLERELVVDDNSSIVADLSLEEDKQILDEVVITGNADKTTDEYTVRSIQNSERVVNIVSAKTIEISPDITVANVVQRVSGISIERNSNGDGQHAIVRGMDKRYNYTLVNGVKIPSPDDKYRYVPLDIFPAEMLDRLEVTKSLTPNMEGDAVGGVINLVMKDAPGSRYVNANIATGFSELFANWDFKSYNYRSINFQSPAEANGSKYAATLSDFPSGNITYKSGNPPLNLLGGVALGDRFFKSKLGLIIAGSYQNTYRGSNSLFYDTDIAGTESNYYLKTKEERKFSEEQIRYGIHLKADYKFNPKHKLQLYNCYLNLSNVQIRDVKSIGLSNGYNPDSGNANLEYSTRARLTIQQILNSTLQGEHTVTKRFKAQWSLVYSLATNEIPDNTTIDLLGKQTNFVETITQPVYMERWWQHNSDRDLAAYLNLFYTVDINHVPVEFSMGGLARNKQRSNLSNKYSLKPLPGRPQFYETDFTSYSDIKWSVTNPQGALANALTYDASENIQAGYAQFKFQVSKTQIIGGVRMEHTDQGYAMKYPVGEKRPYNNQNYVNFLPGLHIKHMLTPKINIRAAYFRSINRPGFLEIVPFAQVFEEYKQIGDADLKHAVADNFDLRYEFFPRSLEQVMVGIFYKNIKDPIEYIIKGDPLRGQDQYLIPGNFGVAQNFGFEIDFVKYFHWFGIKANYTYTNSSITTTKDLRYYDSDSILKTNHELKQTRPLLGQSAHIGNLSFLIKDAKSDINAQLAASYTGERINTISQYLNNDFWQEAFIQMDASFEKTFKKRLTIFLKANNLLDTPLTLFIKNTNPKNDNVPDVTYSGKTLIRKDYYQRSYMAGLRFKL